MRIAALVASALILVSVAAVPARAADFKDYPAKPAFGHVVTPTFTGRNRKHRDYRTMFRWGFKSAPRFAGHYALMGAGCGTGCTFTWLGDLTTGAIYDDRRSGRDPTPTSISTSIPTATPLARAMGPNVGWRERRAFLRLRRVRPDRREVQTVEHTQDARRMPNRPAVAEHGCAHLAAIEGSCHCGAVLTAGRTPRPRTSPIATVRSADGWGRSGPTTLWRTCR